MVIDGNKIGIKGMKNANKKYQFSIVTFEETQKNEKLKTIFIFLLIYFFDVLNECRKGSI